MARGRYMAIYWQLHRQQPSAAVNRPRAISTVRTPSAPPPRHLHPLQPRQNLERSGNPIRQTLPMAWLMQALSNQPAKMTSNSPSMHSFTLPTQMIQNSPQSMARNSSAAARASRRYRFSRPPPAHRTPTGAYIQPLDRHMTSRDCTTRPATHYKQALASDPGKPHSPQQSGYVLRTRRQSQTSRSELPPG